MLWNTAAFFGVALLCRMDVIQFEFDRLGNKDFSMKFIYLSDACGVFTAFIIFLSYRLKS